MPNLIDLRRRIRSVKNTQQITSAMKMVAASKLRRAQQKVIASRPYSSLLREMLAGLLDSLPEDSAVLEHPLLARREEKRVSLLLISGDKGLCGAFNSNVFRAAESFLSKKAGAELDLALIGRRGRDYYKRTNRQVTGEWVDLFSKPIEFAAAKKIAGQLIERYTREEVDAVYLLYNEFKSVLSQKVLLAPLLPIRPAGGNEGARQEYIYEQAPESIFRDLLPRYIQVSVYHAMLESAAAEHASRMTAMDAATRNAGEMIEKLTLHLNRVRQASITNDLIEVISGAQALE
jgi:F-type H+-transporting ATPase subunit gamma